MSVCVCGGGTSLVLGEGPLSSVLKEVCVVRGEELTMCFHFILPVGWLFDICKSLEIWNSIYLKSSAGTT